MQTSAIETIRFFDKPDNGEVFNNDLKRWPL